MPTNFSFARPDYTYDFEVWMLSAALPGLGQAGSTIVAVTVSTSDSKLQQALTRIAVAGRGAFPAPGAVTFVFSALSGG